MADCLKISNADNGNNDYRQCKYAFFKYTWASGAKRDSYDQLNSFVGQNLKFEHDKHVKIMQNITLMQNSGSSVSSNYPIPANIREFNERYDELNILLSKCYLKLGLWQHELDGFGENTINQILSYYQHAIDHNKGWYKAWNAWAYANFEAIQFYKKNTNTSSLLTRQLARTQCSSNLYPLTSIDSSSNVNNTNSLIQHNEMRLQKYIKPAIQGYFNCIKLSSGTPLQETNCFQDTLRLLTLWFDYGNKNDIYETLVDGLNSTPMEIWLQVIPQLIARIDTNKQLVAKLIQKLLIDLGRVHPQALVYRLILASKCPNTFGSTAASVVASNNSGQTARNLAAQKILLALREHCNVLVEQAKLVSEELIRVAILWHELWHESLEDASKLYFAERNVKGKYILRWVLVFSPCYMPLWCR
jgi:FKBP12-rapamycin complex-associated protein